MINTSAGGETKNTLPTVTHSYIDYLSERRGEEFVVDLHFKYDSNFTADCGGDVANMSTMIMGGGGGASVGPNVEDERRGDVLKLILYGESDVVQSPSLSLQCTCGRYLFLSIVSFFLDIINVHVGIHLDRVIVTVLLKWYRWTKLFLCPTRLS